MSKMYLFQMATIRGCTLIKDGYINIHTREISCTLSKGTLVVVGQAEIIENQVFESSSARPWTKPFTLCHIIMQHHLHQLGIQEQDNILHLNKRFWQKARKHPETPKGKISAKASMLEIIEHFQGYASKGTFPRGHPFCWTKQ